MKLPPMKSPARLLVHNADISDVAGCPFIGAFGDCAKMLTHLQIASPASYWIDSVNGRFTARQIIEADARGEIKSVN